MYDSNALDSEALGTLERRVNIGVQCIGLAYGKPGIPAEDRETYAKDAISDILTALYGPAGYCVEIDAGLDPSNWSIKVDPIAVNEGLRIVKEAFESWDNDAEDYTVPLAEADHAGPIPPVNDECPDNDTGDE